MLPLGKPKGERWLVPSGAIDRPCDPKKRRTKPNKKYKYKGTCTFLSAGSNNSSQNRPTMVNDKTARTLPCGRPKGCRGTGTSTDFGTWVWVDHGGGVVSKYGHLASIAVKDGQQVYSYEYSAAE